MQNTSSVLVPAPEHIARVLEKFRNDIRNNAFTISPHANMRMVSRAISHTEMYDAVASGQTVTGRRIPDYIGGRFFHKGLFVAVYSPFGDLGTTPCIVSVCRDGELDDDDGGRARPDAAERSLASSDGDGGDCSLSRSLL